MAMQGSLGGSHSNTGRKPRAEGGACARGQGSRAAWWTWKGLVEAPCLWGLRLLQPAAHPHTSDCGPRLAPAEKRLLCTELQPAWDPPTRSGALMSTAHVVSVFKKFSDVFHSEAVSKPMKVPRRPGTVLAGPCQRQVGIAQGRGDHQEGDRVGDSCPPNTELPRQRLAVPLIGMLPPFAFLVVYYLRTVCSAV